MSSVAQRAEHHPGEDRAAGDPLHRHPHAQVGLGEHLGSLQRQSYLLGESPCYQGRRVRRYWSFFKVSHFSLNSINNPDPNKNVHRSVGGDQPGDGPGRLLLPARAGRSLHRVLQPRGDHPLQLALVSPS